MFPKLKLHKMKLKEILECYNYIEPFKNLNTII